MTRHPRTLIATLYALYFTFLAAGPAGAQTIDPSAPAVELVDFRLLALVPVLIVVMSSILTRAGASSAVKQAVPAVVTGLLVVAYYASQAWPDSFAIVVGHAWVALTLAGKLYDLVDSIAERTAGKRLNDVTGPGLLG